MGRSELPHSRGIGRRPRRWRSSEGSLRPPDVRSSDGSRPGSGLARRAVGRLSPPRAPSPPRARADAPPGRRRRNGTGGAFARSQESDPGRERSELRLPDQLYLSEGPPAHSSILLRTSWHFTDQVVAYEREFGAGRFIHIGLGSAAGTYEDI